MAEQNPFESFLQEYEQYQGIWRSIELRALIGEGENDGVLLALRAYLRDIEPPSGLYQTLFDGATVKAVVEWRDISELRQLLRSLSEISIVICGSKLRIPEAEAGSRPFQFHSSRPRSIDSMEPPFGDFVLFSTYQEVQHCIDHRRVDRELRDWGYARGLVDVTQEKLGFELGYYDRTWVGVIAPIYLVASARLDTGFVEATPLVGSTVLGSDLTVQVEAYGDTEPDVLYRDSLKLSQSERTFVGQHYQLAQSIPVPKGSKRVRLSYFYNGLSRPTDSIVVSTALEPAAVLSALSALGQIRRGQFLTATDMLRQSLGIDTPINDQDRFELGISTLLTLVGFQVIFMGKYFGKGFDIPGIDLLAFEEETKRFVLISCTIDNKLSNKIEGLVSQVNKLRDSLAGWNVTGMICAPVERRDITIGSFLDILHADIDLVLKGEIERLLDFTPPRINEFDHNYSASWRTGGYSYGAEGTPSDLFDRWVRGEDLI